VNDSIPPEPDDQPPLAEQEVGGALSPLMPPARRLQLALDPTTDAEEHVYQALLYHLTEPELGVLAHMVEQARRDRWPH
jgi:hypothetical protein